MAGWHALSSHPTGRSNHSNVYQVINIIACFTLLKRNRFYLMIMITAMVVITNNRSISKVYFSSVTVWADTLPDALNASIYEIPNQFGAVGKS